MSIENGGPDPANRPWARWAIIGATVVAALVGGYWVGTALFGSPQPAQVSIVTPAATLALRPTFTPTLPPTNTPVPTATSAAAAPATQPANAGGAPAAAATDTPLCHRRRRLQPRRPPMRRPLPGRLCLTTRRHRRQRQPGPQYLSLSAALKLRQHGRYSPPQLGRRCPRPANCDRNIPANCNLDAAAYCDEHDSAYRHADVLLQPCCRPRPAH